MPFHPSQRPRRVAFLATHFLDPTTPRSWSGLPYFMRLALGNAGIETEIIMADEPSAWMSWAKFGAWKLLRGKRYFRQCEEKRLRYYARRYEERLATMDVDAVFSPSTWLTAYLETDLPTLFWTDASFAGMLDFYESFTHLAPPSLEAGHRAEQHALDRCTYAIYSSEWAARTARDAYDFDARKVRVIPFGGNLQEPPTLEEVDRAVGNRDASQCELLLVGVEWKRKGAQIAIEAAQSLNARGLRTRLTIVGCSPPRFTRVPAFVDVIPFISKSTATGRRQLDAIYKRSHFFIMPTRAEAFGLVLSEANAFGVPCLTTDIGGLPSVVTDHVNGMLFSAQARGGAYADYILGVMRQPARYAELARNAANEAHSRLSWTHSGKLIADLLNGLPSGTASPTPASAGTLLNLPTFKPLAS